MSDASIIALDADVRKFDNNDRLTIIGLCVLLLIVVALFFVFISLQGLTSFPLDRVDKAVSSGKFDYFAYALEWRERRLSLALTLRTFISSLGFVVGLVLAVIGGVFILRRASIELTASGGWPASLAIGPRSQVVVPVEPVDDKNVVDDGAEPQAEQPAQPLQAQPASPAQVASFSLVTNSPGIVFLIGGVVIIYVTQLLAIEVAAVEIFPRNAVAVCSPSQLASQVCGLDSLYGSDTATGEKDQNYEATKKAAFCRSNPTETECAH